MSKELAVPYRITDCLIAPAIRLDKGEGLAEALRCLREFDPRVFLIFGGDQEDVEWLHETLEHEAGHPILFAADLERGAGQQFGGLTPLPDAWALGQLGPEAAYDAGHRTAAEAASAGVRWIYAPVLDLHRQGPNAINSPIIANRAFGAYPEKVVEIAGAFIKGITDAGGIPCAKHFPGHGACPQDSHLEPGVSFEEPGDHLIPFKELLPLLPSIMVGHLEFPMVDESSKPATRSKYLMDILRKDWGYNGLAVTDALRMNGYGSEPHEELAVESIHAGVDLLLYPEDPVALAITLRDAMERGDLSEECAHQSAQRVEDLLRIALDTEPAKPRPLVLGGGMKALFRPLTGGSPGRYPRPDLALNLSGTPDAISFLEEFGVAIAGPDQIPPADLPEAIVILWGASVGKGLPDIPGAWVEAIQHSHPVVYIAGSPDAPQKAPASARGYSLPGLSPALLSLLLAEGE
jgi:beta-glucosidase-like glycosyl hydrolase